MSGIEQIVGQNIIGTDGKTITDIAGHFEGKIVGLYFSAHWCGPCRYFTPQLVEQYKALKQANRDFEIIFISCDQNQKAFDSYFAEMPWCALDYADRNTQDKVSDKYEVSGIPSLVIVDSKGNTITTSGRNDVMKNSSNITSAYDAWAQQAKN